MHGFIEHVCALLTAVRSMVPLCVVLSIGELGYQGKGAKREHLAGKQHHSGFLTWTVHPICLG